MISRSEVIVHLALGDEGRYVGDAFLRFLFHFLADHIAHRFLYLLLGDLVPFVSRGESERKNTKKRNKNV